MEHELSGKVVVVTGASSSIGMAGATELSRRGATVVPVGRNPAKLEVATKQIQSAAPLATVVADPIQADFSRMDDVRTVADTVLERHPTVHVLVNNAGLLTREREITVDGFEATFAVNHLAPFLLTRLLATAPAGAATTGRYWMRGKPATPRAAGQGPRGRDAALSRERTTPRPLTGKSLVGE